MPNLRGAAKYGLRGWGAVITGGIVLTVLALIDGPRALTTTGVGTATGTGTATATAPVTTADGSTGCQLQVTAPELRVRSGPSVTTDPLETLTQGAVVDGLPEVTDGFRRLKGNRWAANEFLAPVAGTSC